MDWRTYEPEQEIDVTGARVLHLHLPAGTVVMPLASPQPEGDEWFTLGEDPNDLARAWRAFFPPAMDVAAYRRVRFRIVAGTGPVMFMLDAAGVG